MMLRGNLLALFAPLEEGTALLPGVVFEDVSLDLGFRLRFRIGTTRLWVDVGPVSHVRRYAARSTHFALGYRTEGGRSTVDPDVGKRLCEVLAKHAAANESRVLEQLAHDAKNSSDPALREVDIERALEPGGLGGNDYYSLNPYVGCLIGCRFCYAQTPLASFRSLVGVGARPWGAYVDVRRNLPRLLAKELEERKPLPIKFCPVVGDAYQGPEKTHRVTRKCLEVIHASSRDWPVLVLTRSALMMRDVDLIASIPGSWAGVSLPTVDDSVRKHFEPRAASVNERLRLLSMLRRAGTQTLVVVQPMMAGPLDALVDAVAAHADAAVIDLLQEEEGARGDFDHESFDHTRRREWQQARALELLSALKARRVPVWASELPPAYCAPTEAALR